MRRWLVAWLLACALVLTGCSGDEDAPAEQNPSKPPANVPDAVPVVTALAEGLDTAELTQTPFVDSAKLAAAQEDLDIIMARTGDIQPAVEFSRMTYGPGDAQATGYVAYTWEIDTSTWEYETAVPLKLTGGKWYVEWSPTIVHPNLTEESRLRVVREMPRRAAIEDSDGIALVEQMTMFQVGLDKGAIGSDQWDASATEIAKLVDIDAEDYKAKVHASGERQFVVARTMRQEEITPDISEVPGSHVAETERMVPFSPTFAVGLLGTSGPATAEIIEESEGAIQEGDLVGLSGLQARYDEQLRGSPEMRVDLIARAAEEGGSAPEVETEALFTQDASVGSPVKLSMDRGLQERAEEVLSSQEGLAALVVIRPSDGAVLVAANSPSAGEYPQATFGKFAPGSTFKVVSSLAMLRQGMTPSSTVQCPATIEVNGRKIGNYSGYPSAFTGSVTLTEALAHSCNTAFATAGADMTAEELHAAAGSLGMGTDYDVGFPAYFGTVDPSSNNIDMATSMFGQSQITAAPLTMAAVAASVAKGETVIPWLVEGHQAESTADPLTEQEAEQLQGMMRAVVDSGSAQVLKGTMLGAKTGTAEYGEAGKLQTHAWMIAWNEDYAVAAFVEQGESGSATAAPLIEQLFS